MAQQPINLHLELMVLNAMMLAMIRTHPDRASLRAQFAALIGQIEVGGIAAGIPPEHKQAFQAVYRRYLETLDETPE